MIRHMRHGSSPRLMAFQPIRVLDPGESLTDPIGRSPYDEDQACRSRHLRYRAARLSGDGPLANGSRALRFGVPVQALVTLRRTWPSVRLDHSGRQLGLVRATGQGELILREPNGAAQVRSFQTSLKQIRTSEVDASEIKLLQVGPRKIGVGEAHNRKLRVCKDGAGHFGFRQVSAGQISPAEISPV